MSVGPGFYRGTTHEQTPYFANKEKKMIESKKWPSSFFKKVDISKVSLDVIKPWISKRITELLGVEDEIVINYCTSQLKAETALGDASSGNGASANTNSVTSTNADTFEIDPKILQINLTGFMAKNTGIFVQELWELLLSAQDNPSGIPQQFLEEKKEEIRRKKQEQLRIQEELEKRHNLVKTQAADESIKKEDAVEAAMNVASDHQDGTHAENEKVKSKPVSDEKISHAENEEKSRARHTRGRRTVSSSSGSYRRKRYASSESGRSVSRESVRRKDLYNRRDDRRRLDFSRRYGRDYIPSRSRHDSNYYRRYRASPHRSSRYGPPYDRYGKNRYTSLSRERSPYHSRRREGPVSSTLKKDALKPRATDKREYSNDDSRAKRENAADAVDVKKSEKYEKSFKASERPSKRSYEERPYETHRGERGERERVRRERERSDRISRRGVKEPIMSGSHRGKALSDSKSVASDASADSYRHTKNKVVSKDSRKLPLPYNKGKASMKPFSSSFSSSSSMSQRSSSSVSVASSSVSHERPLPPVKSVTLTKKTSTGRLRAWSPSSSNVSNNEKSIRYSKKYAKPSSYNNRSFRLSYEREESQRRSYRNASGKEPNSNKHSGTSEAAKENRRERDASDSYDSGEESSSVGSIESQGIHQKGKKKHASTFETSSSQKLQQRTHSEEVLRQKALGLLKRKASDKTVE